MDEGVRYMKQQRIAYRDLNCLAASVRSPDGSLVSRGKLKTIINEQFQSVELVFLMLFRKELNALEAYSSTGLTPHAAVRFSRLSGEANK